MVKIIILLTGRVHACLEYLSEDLKANFLCITNFELTGEFYRYKPTTNNESASGAYKELTIFYSQFTNLIGLIIGWIGRNFCQRTKGLE